MAPTASPKGTLMPINSKIAIKIISALTIRIVIYLIFL